MKKKIIFVNTHASRALRNLDEIKKTLKDKKFNDYKLVVIKDPKDLTVKINKELKNGKPNLIALGGGDGTIITGIDHLQKKKYKGKIGILPIGTANYFAKNLNIPVDVSSSLEILQREDTKPIYLAKANDKLFSLMATMGVTSEISKNVGVKQKRKYRQFAYIIELFKNIFNYRTFTYSIKYDSYEEILKGKCLDILVTNADRGSGIKVIPSNSMQVPKLKLTIYKSQNALQAMLTLLVYIASAGSVKKGITVIHAHEAEIITSPSKVVAIDGEAVLETPLKVKIIQKPVDLVCI